MNNQNLVPVQNNVPTMPIDLGTFNINKVSFASDVYGNRGVSNMALYCEHVKFVGEFAILKNVKKVMVIQATLKPEPYLMVLDNTVPRSRNSECKKSEYSVTIPQITILRTSVIRVESHDHMLPEAIDIPNWLGRSMKDAIDIANTTQEKTNQKTIENNTIIRNDFISKFVEYSYATHMKILWSQKNFLSRKFGVTRDEFMGYNVNKEEILGMYIDEWTATAKKAIDKITDINYLD